MNKILNFFLLLVLVVIDYGCNKSSYNYALDELQGGWIQKDYLQKLSETKSPVKTEITKSPLLCVVNKNNNENVYTFTLGSNFHYADISNSVIIRFTSVGATRKYRLDLENSNTQIVVEPLNESEMIIAVTGKPLEYYTRQHMIKNYRKHVNEILLAGDYITEDGVTCSFSVNGDAILPSGNVFSYEIVLDTSSSYYDWIRDTKNRDNVYVYKWDNDKLLFYDAYYSFESDSINPTGNPIILTKID
jgi:hypothetical protein